MRSDGANIEPKCGVYFDTCTFHKCIFMKLLAVLEPNGFYRGKTFQVPTGFGSEDANF